MIRVGARITGAPLLAQYGDYTLWQHQLLGDQADPTSLFSNQIGYWTRTWGGLSV